MPRFRKLSPAEIVALAQPTLDAHAQVVREYDAYMADFSTGDYGWVEIAAGERRVVARDWLQAATRRRGLALRFHPGPGAALFFYVKVTLAPMVRPAPPAPAANEPSANV